MTRRAVIGALAASLACAAVLALLSRSDGDGRPNDERPGVRNERDLDSPDSRPLSSGGPSARSPRRASRNRRGASHDSVRHATDESEQPPGTAMGSVRERDASDSDDPDRAPPTPSELADLKSRIVQFEVDPSHSIVRFDTDV